MKTVLILAALALAGCQSYQRGQYTFTPTFKEADAPKVEQRLAEIHWFNDLKFSAEEVTAYPSDYGTAYNEGDFYKVDVEATDCMWHTQLLEELLQVGYAQNGKTLASVPSSEAAKADPSHYDCNGKYTE